MILAGVWTGVGFWNLKNGRIRTRIQKFWNTSGVGVWKSDSGHLGLMCMTVYPGSVYLCGQLPSGRDHATTREMATFFWKYLTLKNAMRLKAWFLAQVAGLLPHVLRAERLVLVAALPQRQRGARRPEDQRTGKCGPQCAAVRWAIRFDFSWKLSRSGKQERI